MRTVARVLVVIVATAVGLAVGIAGGFFHEYTVGLAGIDLPVGLVGSLVAAAATFVLTGLLVGNRLAVLGPGLAWVVPVLMLASPRPEGDLVVGATAAGYILLLGGAITIGLCVAFPYRAPVRTGETAG